MAEYDDDWMREIAESFRHAEKAADETKQQFEKLNLDRCMEIPNVGDTVIVAAGLLGMGFPWVRYEALVLATGQNSYRVRFLDYEGFRDRVVEQWIHPALVTDVIRQPQPA